MAAEAADAAVLTDVFDPVLRDLKVSFNGAAWTEGADYTYVGGVFTTVRGRSPFRRPPSPRTPSPAPGR